MDALREKLDVPEAVRRIAQRLEDAGYETWAVGGAVRDALLGRSRADWDLATAARPSAVRKLFRPSYPIGVEFGTVGVRGEDGNVYEVTTFRRDVETDGRHAVVEYADEIDDDLARRDFTINAIAYHPLRETLRDPYGGRDDLRRRVLRCVGEPALRFAEDYLRILRGLRFAGRYELEIERATWDALTKAVPNLPRLSGERIREELLKVLESPSASSALELYRKSGALLVTLAPVARLNEADWAELLRTIDSIPARRSGLRLAALMAPAATELEATMTRLRFSNAEKQRCVELSRALALPLPAADDVVAARRWLRDVGPERARDALRLHVARARGRRADRDARIELSGQVRLVLSVIRRGDAVRIADLAIDGSHLKALGLEPGPEFGRILDDCLEAVIMNPELNRSERLLDYVREGLRE